MGTGDILFLLGFGLHFTVLTAIAFGRASEHKSALDDIVDVCHSL